MLVLTRHLNQTITIGDPASAGDAIEITIVEVRGDQVRIGISAPRSVTVHRKEIWQQIQDENRASAASGKPPELPEVRR